MVLYILKNIGLGIDFHFHDHIRTSHLVDDFLCLQILADETLWNSRKIPPLSVV